LEGTYFLEKGMGHGCPFSLRKFRLFIAKKTPQKDPKVRERERECDFGKFASKISNLFKYNN
jgi:hypothetical protein